jgi:hypothetical protein
LIYSRAFDELPDEMRACVWRRLWEVLEKQRDADKFPHLAAEDRQAIVEILRETKQDLPAYWREASATP